jgi:hypothetical protein
MKSGNPNVYRPPGVRTEVDVAAEICVRVLNSDLFPRTPRTIAKLAMATGVPVDRIRQAWAMAPARNVPLDRSPVNESEPLAEPVKRSHRAEPAKIHRGKPPAKPSETPQDRFARRAKSAITTVHANSWVVALAGNSNNPQSGTVFSSSAYFAALSEDDGCHMEYAVQAVAGPVSGKQYVLNHSISQPNILTFAIKDASSVNGPSVSPNPSSQTLLYKKTLPTMTVAVTATPGDGSITSYAWTCTAKPSGSTATINSATSSSTTVTYDKSGSYTLHCVVTDSNSQTGTADCTVIVKATAWVNVGGSLVPVKAAVHHL